MRLAERAEMSENLQHALVSRAVIDQALGIVGHNRCTAQEAFEILNTTSQNRNIKIRDIALPWSPRSVDSPALDGQTGARVCRAFSRLNTACIFVRPGRIRAKATTQMQ